MRVCLGNISKSAVSQELVELACRNTGIKVEYSPTHDPSDLPKPRMDAFSYPYTPLKASVWTDDADQNLGLFWEEYDRLSRIVKKPLDEPILRDDFPLKTGYMYLRDSQPFEFLEEPMTVRRYLNRFPQYSEIRRCDIYGRINRQPLKYDPVVREVKESTHKNTRRKNKKTYKIKNVAL